MKNWSNLYLGDEWVKELVVICDHVHFSYNNEWPWQNPCDSDTGNEQSVGVLCPIDRVWFNNVVLANVNRSSKELPQCSCCSHTAE